MHSNDGGVRLTEAVSRQKETEKNREIDDALVVFSSMLLHCLWLSFIQPPSQVLQMLVMFVLSSYNMVFRLADLYV